MGREEKWRVERTLAFSAWASARIWSLKGKLLGMPMSLGLSGWRLRRRISGGAMVESEE